MFFAAARRLPKGNVIASVRPSLSSVIACVRVIASVREEDQDRLLFPEQTTHPQKKNSGRAHPTSLPRSLTSLPRSLVLCLRKVVRYLKLTVESVVASTLGLLQGAYIASALRKIIQPGMRQRACKDF